MFDVSFICIDVSSKFIPISMVYLRCVFKIYCYFEQVSSVYLSGIFNENVSSDNTIFLKDTLKIHQTKKG